MTEALEEGELVKVVEEGLPLRQLPNEHWVLHTGSRWIVMETQDYLVRVRPIHEFWKWRTFWVPRHVLSKLTPLEQIAWMGD